MSLDQLAEVIDEGTYGKNRTGQIVTNADLRNVARPRCDHVVAPRLVTVSRPAVTSTGSRVGRRAVAGDSSRDVGEVEDIVAIVGVGSENGVRSGDDVQSEWRSAANLRIHLGEVLGQTAVSCDIPDGEVALAAEVGLASHIDSLNRCDQIFLVFRENDLGESTAGSEGGSDLRLADETKALRYRDEACRVDGITTVGHASTTRNGRATTEIRTSRR